MTTRNRPLSPHLQVYKLPLSAVLSITHRFTGLILAVGLLFLAYWVGSAAYGPDAFNTAQAFMGSWFGVLCLFVFSYALFYHLCNGVRHLVWDAGFGFTLKEVNSSGWVVVVASGGLTLLTWIIGLVML